MSKKRMIYHDGELLGRRLTKKEFLALDFGKVFDEGITACGAEGIIFQREDGSIGVEDEGAVYEE